WSVAGPGVAYDVRVNGQDGSRDAQVQMWKLVNGSYTRIRNTSPTEIAATSSAPGSYVLVVFSPSGGTQAYTLTLHHLPPSTVVRWGCYAFVVAFDEQQREDLDAGSSGLRRRHSELRGDLRRASHARVPRVRLRDRRAGAAARERKARARDRRAVLRLRAFAF